MSPVLAGGVVGTIIFAASAWLFRIELQYMLWRLVGGLRIELRQRGVESIQELYEMPEEMAFCVSSYDAGADAAEMLLEAIDDDIEVPVSVVFQMCYFVDSTMVKRGCHGTYSLARAFFYGERVGGDPVCGGHQSFKVTDTIKKREIQVLKDKMEDAKLPGRYINGYIIGDTAEEALEEVTELGCQIYVYLGSESIVHAYLGSDPEGGRHNLIPVYVEYAV